MWYFISPICLLKLFIQIHFNKIKLAANQYRVQLQSAPTLQPVSTQGKIELMLIGANNFNETFTLTK